MRTPAFPILALVAALVAATLQLAPAMAADHPGREGAWLLPRSAAEEGPRPAEVDDRLRPPLPGATSPTDPRDGRDRERSPEEESDLRRMAARALGVASPEAGGDDVLATQVEYPDNVEMDIASNGDIYLAVGLDPSEVLFEEYIEVYRSTDGGSSFTLFGSINSPANNYDRLYDINVVEGSVDRVFVTYMYFNDSQGGFDFRVAYEDLAASSASWTIRTVMDVPGVSFLGPDMADDSLAFSGFYLYAVCAGLDGNGDDIWFSRSTDYGNSWSAPYRVAQLTSSGNLMYTRPRAAVGQGGLVHVAFGYTERLQSTMDDGVRYMKATNFAGASTDWGSILTLYSTTDGVETTIRDIVAAPTSSSVAVFTSAFFGGVGPKVLSSYTDGNSWTILDEFTLPFASWVEACYDPGNARVVAGGRISGAPNEMAVVHAPIADLTDSWSSPVNFADISSMSSSPDVAVDPSRGHQIATAWRGYVGSESWATFDAEWRDGDGYPNYDPGFPVTIPSDFTIENRTAPAIVNLDADPYAEIVFGDTDGNIHVLSHLGTYPGAWPVDVGGIPYRAPVAVGDLNGDGQMAIVAGGTTGTVWALDPSGNLMDGFPVDLGTGAPTYVSIGTVGGPYPRWIFAASGNRMARISYRGEVNFKSGTLNGTYTGPAAIGDVDDDGLAEVVVGYLGATGNGGLHLYNGDLSGGTTNRSLGADTVSDAVTLADIDLNGDLEIFAPTHQGRMYAIDHTMVDHPGFPFDSGLGAELTSAHFANILGTSQPELMFSSRTGYVHVVYYNGVQQSGFPALTDNFWWLRGSPIPTSLQGHRNWVTVGSRNELIYTFRNVGAIAADGWPRGLRDRIEVSPARGDLDNDGRLELVFLGNEALHVLDVGPPTPSDDFSWNMGGHDAQRTGCHDCDYDLATAAPGPTTTRVVFRLDSQNPSPGPVSFTATLPGPGIVELEIIDALGRRVRQVERRSLAGGTHTLGFDGRDGAGQRIARGQYFARLSVQGAGFREVQVQRFLLVD